MRIGSEEKIIIASKVQYGYHTKTDLTIPYGFWPASISIRQDIEFAFSKGISSAYLEGCFSYPDAFQCEINYKKAYISYTKLEGLWDGFWKAEDRKIIARHLGCG